MMTVNDAYERGDRSTLERLLLAAGELPERVIGGPADAVRAWLGLCEHMVQGRIRVVQAQTLVLQNLQMHQLRVAIERAEAGGMKPLDIMAARLRAQIAAPGALHRRARGRRCKLGGGFFAQAVSADDRTGPAISQPRAVKRQVPLFSTCGSLVA
jgi:hypothetical protein